MLNRIKITFWIIKNNYYLHLYYSLFFFFNKTFIKKIRYNEKLSFKEAEKLCKKFATKDENLYEYFSKKKYVAKKPYNQKKNKKTKYKMGGGSHIKLIYNLIRILKPKKIIEFGVANGWSTNSILLACKKNNKGSLISIDMPYYFKNAKNLIGNLVDKKKFPNWTLLIGPQVSYLKKIENQKFDFCHYDSDKSYQAKNLVYSKIWKILNKKGILLSDDVADNLAFFHFCKKIKRKPRVIRFKKKYLGLIIK